MEHVTGARAAEPDPREWLERETSAWSDEGLIRPEQRLLILARYGLAEGESPRSLRQSHLAALVSIVGAVLVGAGILILVGASWMDIPRAARLVILLAAMLGCYGIGWRLSGGAGRSPGVGKALILTGSLVWLSGIFLVGQMYHLGGAGDPEYARGLVYGFAGLLPLAYVLRSPTQMALALFTLTAFVMTRALNTGSPVTFGNLLTLGSFVYVAGLWHRRFEAEECLSPTLVKFGLALAALSLLGLSLLTESPFPEQEPHGGNLGLLALTAAAATAYAVRARRGADPTGVGEAVGCLVVVASAVVLAFLREDTAFVKSAITIVSNVLLLALTLACVWLGWIRSRPGLINGGLVLFFIHLLVRYFDTFASMLDGGAAFVGMGALILLGGWALERQRRRLLDTMPAPTGGLQGGSA